MQSIAVAKATRTTDELLALVRHIAKFDHKPS
jgi:hypothetical protein